MLTVAIVLAASGLLSFLVTRKLSPSLGRVSAVAIGLLGGVITGVIAGVIAVYVVHTVLPGLEPRTSAGLAASWGLGGAVVWSLIGGVAGAIYGSRHRRVEKLDLAEYSSELIYPPNPPAPSIPTIPTPSKVGDMAPSNTHSASVRDTNMKREDSASDAWEIALSVDHELAYLKKQADELNLGEQFKDEFLKIKDVKKACEVFEQTKKKYFFPDLIANHDQARVIYENLSESSPLLAKQFVKVIELLGIDYDLQKIKEKLLSDYNTKYQTNSLDENNLGRRDWLTLTTYRQHKIRLLRKSNLDVNFKPGDGYCSVLIQGRARSFPTELGFAKFLLEYLRK